MQFKTFVAVSAFTLLAAVSPCSAQSSSWDIDPKHSKITFVALRSNHIAATGKFTNISGTIDHFNGFNLQPAKVSAQIPIATITTGIIKRDTDLKSPKYFDMSKFANATFTAEGVRETDEKRYILGGQLNIHGVTKWVDLALDPPVISGKKDKEHFQATATTVISPMDFALDLRKLHPEGLVRVDLVELQFSIAADKVPARVK